MVLSDDQITRLREKATNYLKSWIKTPYQYAGNDFAGMDCSGIQHEVLQAWGLERRGFDSTAEELYQANKKFTVEDPEDPEMGCLVFWFKGGKAEHVEMITDFVGPLIFTTGASGGGSKTGFKKDEAEARKDAIRDNAYIKINPITYRDPQTYKICDPFQIFKQGE